ncbi:hypothetical protein [Pyramidobacter piscolens]|uniref:hypothetical protein n=1 Tax=Pyramidobacter piscolens TaxID=638849 RepID=UPI002AB17976|nr:hypothetical protein [Pyramidobacter piscolens]
MAEKWTFKLAKEELWDLNRHFDSLKEATRAGQTRAKEFGQKKFYVASLVDVPWKELQLFDEEKVIDDIEACLEDEYGEAISKRFRELCDYDAKQYFGTVLWNAILKCLDDFSGELQIIDDLSVKEIEVKK